MEGLALVFSKENSNIYLKILVKLQKEKTKKNKEKFFNSMYDQNLHLKTFSFHFGYDCKFKNTFSLILSFSKFSFVIISIKCEEGKEPNTFSISNF